jgi:hypothetical protein
VLFVFFVAKQQADPPSPTTYAKATVVKRLRRTGRKQTMKLHEAIRGMEVKSWERRENSSGKCTVYVRFVPKSSAPTVSVKEAA